MTEAGRIPKSSQRKPVGFIVVAMLGIFVLLALGDRLLFAHVSQRSGDNADPEAVLEALAARHD